MSLRGGLPVLVRVTASSADGLLAASTGAVGTEVRDPAVPAQATISSATGTADHAHIRLTGRSSHSARQPPTELDSDKRNHRADIEALSAPVGSSWLAGAVVGIVVGASVIALMQFGRRETGGA